MTLYEKLISLGLPVSSATDAGAVSFLPGATLTPEQEEIYQIAILEFFGRIEKLAMLTAQKAAVTDYGILPEWAKTGTAQAAETYILSQVWNGQTQAQVDAWVDANITNVTTANVSQINIRLASIRAGLKLAAGAVVGLRGLFILTSKLLIYVRDLVIRYRKN